MDEPAAAAHVDVIHRDIDPVVMWADLSLAFTAGIAEHLGDLVRLPFVRNRARIDLFEQAGRFGQVFRLWVPPILVGSGHRVPMGMSEFLSHHIECLMVFDAF